MTENPLQLSHPPHSEYVYFDVYFDNERTEMVKIDKIRIQIEIYDWFDGWKKSAFRPMGYWLISENHVDYEENEK